MAPNPKINNRGQAFLESLVTLPAYILLLSGCLGGGYLALAVQWTDYWSYRANICLVEDQEVWQCRELLQKRLGLVVPQKNFEVTRLWKTTNRAQCSVQLRFGGLFQKLITSRVPLPLSGTTLALSKSPP